jgi:hypothetical protein
MFVWNKLTRILLLLLLYGAVLAASLYVAFQLRFDFYPAPYMDRFRLGLVISLGLTLPLLWLFGQFRSLLSYFGLAPALSLEKKTSFGHRKIFLGIMGAHLCWLGGLLSSPIQYFKDVRLSNS